MKRKWGLKSIFLPEAFCVRDLVAIWSMAIELGPPEIQKSRSYLRTSHLRRKLDLNLCSAMSLKQMAQRPLFRVKMREGAWHLEHSLTLSLAGLAFTAGSPHVLV